MMMRLLLPALVLGCNDKPAEGTFVGNPGKMDVSAAPTAGVQMRSGSGTIDRLALLDCGGDATNVDLGADVVGLVFDGLVATTEPPLRLPEGTWCGLELDLSTLSLVALSELGEFELSYDDLRVTMDGGELEVQEQTYGLQLAHPEWLDLLRLHEGLSDEHRAVLRSRIEDSSALVASAEGTDTPVGQNGEGQIAPEDLLWSGDDRPDTQPLETGEPTADTAPTGSTADTGATGRDTVDTGATPTADTGQGSVRSVYVDWSVDPLVTTDGARPSLAVSGVGVPAMVFDDGQSNLLFHAAPPWTGLGTSDLQLIGSGARLAPISGDNFLITFDADASSPGLALLSYEGDLQALASWQALTGTASGATPLEASGFVFVSWLQEGVDGTRSAVLQAFDGQLDPLDEALVVGSSVVDAPHLAGGPDGSVGLVWTEAASSPFGIDTHEIWARRYAPQGSATTFRVDTAGSVTSRDADLVIGGTGMAAAWLDEGRILLRSFDPVGVPLTGEVEVGQGTSPPTLVWVDDQLLLVVWGSDQGVHVASVDPTTGAVDGEPVVLSAQIDALSEVQVAVLPEPTMTQTLLSVAWTDGDLGGMGALWWAEATVSVLP